MRLTENLLESGEKVRQRQSPPRSPIGFFDAFETVQPLAVGDGETNLLRLDEKTKWLRSGGVFFISKKRTFRN